MTMIKVTTTIMTTSVTTMITTTTKTLVSKIQYFAAMHDCSCLFKTNFYIFKAIFKNLKSPHRPLPMTSMDAMILDMF